MLSGGKHQGPHKIQGAPVAPRSRVGHYAPHSLADAPVTCAGIGAGFIPGNADLDMIDEVIQVADDDAMATARMLATTEGVMCGISSGASVFAAKQIAARPENKGKKIVCIIPSFGERYLSTALYANLWEEATAQTAEPLE